MVFLALVAIAVFLYGWGYKGVSLFIFFFLLTSGFNLIPEESMSLGLISKGSDYALIQLSLILLLDAFCVKDYFKINTLVTFGIIFYCFLFLCVLWSKFHVHLTWAEIIRTCRFQFFWLAYFVIRNIDIRELKKVLNYLFYTTLITSCIYLLQQFTGTNILNGGMVGIVSVSGMRLWRFYNQPETLYFFLFLGLYYSPFKKAIPKYVANLLLLAAFLFAFHRSWTGFFFLSLILGYAIRQTRIRQIKIFAGTFIILFPLVLFAGNKFMKSRTFIDISAVAKGDFVNTDFDIHALENATFTFRMGHLFERTQYLNQHLSACVLGAGLVPEDSKKVEKMFDFKIGLMEQLTGKTIQLDTGDISYSVLFMRFGYVGTFLYVLIYFYLIYFFYRNRRSKYAFVSFLFLVLMFGVSFFSASIILPITVLLSILAYVVVSKEKIEGIPEEGRMKMIGNETK